MPEPLKPCQHCNHDLAADAKTCVHCGSPTPFQEEKVDEYQEHRKLAKFLWVVFILVFIAGIICTCIFPGCRP